MIRAAFNKHKSAFIPFVMAGYPDINLSTAAVLALANAGADVIELGVPFSDPIADGPVNQRAAEIAIQGGTNLSRVLNQVQEIRNSGCQTPIILFSYLNPILVFGYEKFCQTAKAAGADGILIVDLPPEEGADFYALAKKSGLEIVLLVSPTTDPERLSAYAKLQPSFIYYISRLSVTGIQQDLSHSLAQELDELRNLLPEAKIAVGFGISSLAQAKYVSRIADGVIVGSKLVGMLTAFNLSAFSSLATEFADAIHGSG